MNTTTPAAGGSQSTADTPVDDSAPEFRKVLLVDDDPAIRRIVSKILDSHGYEVTQAANGAEAVEALKRDLPSFVITDWDMPVLDGIEFCRTVRGQKLSRYVYIIMLTGSFNEGQVEGLNSGADDFLVKPAKPQELLARIQSGARVLRLEERLHLLATRDSLTELLNRRTFFEIVEKAWERALRNALPLASVMIDVDLFKRINDTHGHPAGDAVIRFVARLIEGNCRDSDTVCRYGGEEFCVLLPDSDERGAIGWAERCRLAIAREPCLVGDTRIPVSVSLGAAQRSETTDNPEQLLDHADRALLAAKRLGRNRVVGFESLD